MGNWSIKISGIGSKKTPRESAQLLVDALMEDGQNLTSAEFISDTVEDSANLLVARDAKVAEFVSARDGGKGYAARRSLRPEFVSARDGGKGYAAPEPVVEAQATLPLEPPKPVEKPTETPDGAP